MEQYDPLKMELDILKFWEERRIFDKLKKVISKSKKRFSFYDGPITANNPMGVHHGEGRTYKDLYLRFRAMQRFNERFQNGFDCQGLWVEREVEKELNFKGKDDIEKYGILNFVKACKKRVDKYSKQMINSSIRLGQWMDWNDSYYTMSDKSNEYKWHFLKKCFENGWLYKGKDVVPWCARCFTASSKHDIATEGYKELTHVSIYMAFPIVGKNENILVWTTTPWTVPANVAVAVHPDLTYVKAEDNGKFYWIAESKVSALKPDFKIIEKKKGKDLAGLFYEMPFKGLPAQKGAPHKIVLWKEVSAEEGTGMVHIAPGCGLEDYQLGKQEKLPAISPLDDTGHYVKGFDWLTGASAGSIGEEIIGEMKKGGYIYKTEKYTHRYPCCWRCGEELVFRLVDEWYIAVADVRKKMIEENRKIKWVPEKSQKYEEDWLNNMGDWLISRKRYWGLPLPIWECSCGNIEVIGSKEELKKKAVEGFGQLEELHRPWVDNVKIKCPKCGKAVSRVIDTGDVWLDAGIMPFFTLDYLTDKKHFNDWYPADFITECGPGQYRCWFYSMLIHAIIFTGKSSFKSVMTYESVKDATGREMHKSWGNAVWLDEALAKMGADYLRWTYSLQDINKELFFGFESIKKNAGTLMILYNLANYLQTYLNANKSKPTVPKNPDKASKWMLSRLETTKKNVVKHLDDLTPYLAAKDLDDFIVNDVSRWYGHIIRDDIKAESSYEHKADLLNTLYYVLFETTKMLAPFVPFITEYLYQSMFKKYEKEESIHLCEWPAPNKDYIEERLESQMSTIKDLVEASNSLRLKKAIKLKYALPVLNVSGGKDTKDAIKSLEGILKKMANVNKVKLGEINVSIEAKINYSVAGKKFGKDIKEISTLLAKANPKKLKEDIDKSGKAKLGKFTVKKDDIIFKESSTEDMAEFKDGRVSLDMKISPELKQGWFVKEFMRAIQEARKKLGLNVSKKIKVIVQKDEAFKRFEKTITDSTGSTLVFSEPAGEKFEFEFEDKKYYFGVKL